MSRRRTGMTVNEQLACEQEAVDVIAAGELIAALWEGRGNIHQQRRAARFLHQWMPRGMQELPPLRASAALLVRVEAAIAIHNNPAAAYKAIAAEDGTDARSVERQHDRAKAAEQQFADESRRKFFEG